MKKHSVLKDCTNHASSWLIFCSIACFVLHCFSSLDPCTEALGNLLERMGWKPDWTYAPEEFGRGSILVDEIIRVFWVDAGLKALNG